MQSPLELWGGVECTVNRVHDVYHDQLEKSGHRTRAASDLKQFAALGLRTLRVALHWEEFEKTQSWKQWDDVLATMEDLQIKPIIGFVHHGSGPHFHQPLDPQFAEKLAGSRCRWRHAIPTSLTTRR